MADHVTPNIDPKDDFLEIGKYHLYCFKYCENENLSTFTKLLMEWKKFIQLRSDPKIINLKDKYKWY